MPVEVTDAEVEVFRPGRVLHTLLGGLMELALASVCLGLASEAGARNQSAQTSLAAAALLWLVLGLRDLARALLRARVTRAELGPEGVTTHGLLGARSWRWDQLSEVQVSRRRTRLVTRDGRASRLWAVSGPAQGARFQARVTARAEAAAAAGMIRQRPVGGPDTLRPHRPDRPGQGRRGSDQPDPAGSGGTTP